MQAPIAPRRPHVHLDHGVERDDPWHWLRDREDPAVIAYIEAENAFTEERTAHLKDLVDRLFEEMKSKILSRETF